MKKGENNNLFLILAALILAVFLFPKEGLATEYRSPEIKIFNTITLQADKSFLAFDQNFQGGAATAIGDLGGDGINELVIAPGPGGGPHIKIFRSNGSLINSFFAYNEGYRKGINLAAGDLDGDGKDEIITSTRYGGTPHIRVFDGFGVPKFSWGFFAFSEDFQGGVNLAACDLNGNGQKEIIAAAGPGGSPHARVFDKEGNYLGLDFYPFAQDEKGGITVACANVDDGNEEEVIFGIQTSGEPWVKVYKGNESQTVLGQYLVFAQNFKGGVNVAGGDIDYDGQDEVIVSANAGGGPHIRSFEAYGSIVPKSLFAYENEFRGGTLISVGDVNNDSLDEIIASPNRRSTEGRTDLEKYIEIDISDQQLSYYEHGYLKGKFPVSTGKWTMPTPIGTFAINNKIPRAYSRTYDLYMPYWMSFVGGSYGIHELPEWANGYKEGVDHLGTRVSHGCVRLGVGPAKELYDWAEIGTVVIVQE